MQKFIKKNKDLIMIGLGLVSIFISYKIYKKKKEKPVFYIVKKGDSLSKIAKKFNTNWQTLAKINRLKNPNLIKTGQKLRVR